jgi:hypothetical protein
VSHKYTRAELKREENERESIRAKRRLLKIDAIPELPEDLCDDCGLPLPEDCECCPTGEHNPGDPNCDCEFSEPGDRGRKV